MKARALLLLWALGPAPAAAAQAEARIAAVNWDGSQPRPPLEAAPGCPGSAATSAPDRGSQPPLDSAPAHLQEAEAAQKPAGDRSPLDSGGAVVVPGSIFDWKPVETSPGHGFPPLDALARKLGTWKDRRFEKGFSSANVASRDEARVFVYGESHRDEGLILENMRRMASDMRRGRGAIILDEAYFGPRLLGQEALRYLARKGFDPQWLVPDAKGLRIELAGWDDREVYDATRRPLLEHSVELLEINQHLHGDERGWTYYSELGRKALMACRSWLRARRLAIGPRNAELDKSLQDALKTARDQGMTVHVIAGAEHLVEGPLLVDAPLIGGYRLRGGLLRAMSGWPYWVAMPPASPDPPAAPAPASPAPASAEELAFAVQAPIELGRIADDQGAGRGLKGSAMTGGDFLALVQEGRALYAARQQGLAPSARALSAALAVQDQVLRVAAALLEPAQPLYPQVRRLLSVWTVFNQAMEEASAAGALEAIQAEAELFATQVEQSVPPRTQAQ